MKKLQKRLLNLYRNIQEVIEEKRIHMLRENHNGSGMVEIKENIDGKITYS
jgi:hypothetical protein